MVEISFEWLLLLVILLFLNVIINIVDTIWKLIVHFCAPDWIDLKTKYGEWAVITGSTDGIGKEYAKELAKRNLNVVLISRNYDKLVQVKSEIEKINSAVEVKIIQADFSVGKDELTRIEGLLKEIPVGILVNNVGVMTDSLDYHGKIPKKVLWDMVAVNTGAVTLMTHTIIEQMKNRGRGAVVNVSSASELMPMPLQAVYAATKIFVRYFSDAIRLEYGRNGITIQCLSPFYINTKMADFNPTVKNHDTLYPDAAKYAKSAIKTLGRLDSTSGYWVHEIMTFVSLLSPMWLRSRLSLILNQSIRRDYLRYQKETRD